MDEEGFEAEKIDMETLLRNSGMENDRISRIMESVKTGYDLENVRGMFNHMLKYEPSGGDPQKPPTHSVVRKGGGDNSGEWTFNSVREGIDYLYSEEAKGNVEAKRRLDALRRKVEKNFSALGNLSFSITECPYCSAGITSNQDICPACGGDLALYRSGGGVV